MYCSAQTNMVQKKKKNDHGMCISEYRDNATSAGPRSRHDHLGGKAHAEAAVAEAPLARRGAQFEGEGLGGAAGVKVRGEDVEGALDGRHVEREVRLGRRIDGR